MTNIFYRQGVKENFLEELINNRMQHKLILNNRNSLSITGVTEVLSFDVKEILLETTEGMLMIRGSEMHVTKLTVEKGEVAIEGRIDSFTYSESVSRRQENQNFLSRLFQ